MSDSFGRRLAASAKALAKVAIHSRKARYDSTERSAPMIILGNGPSLNDTIASGVALLQKADTMAVNFFGNSEAFDLLRPKYYILADPHFFANTSDPNVARLIANLRGVGWDMTLFVPFAARKIIESARLFADAQCLKVEYFNAIGAEGFGWITRRLYRSRRAMPRPRNVLIPAIMTAIGMGYKQIYIVGADHSWTRTLSVDDENHVVSIQPHFYREDEHEEKRVRAEYLQYPLHQILESFFVAFRAYHDIERFAKSAGVEIFNATPGSYIDAFPRRNLRGL